MTNLLSIVLFFGALVVVGRYVKEPVACYLLGFFACKCINWIEGNDHVKGGNPL